MFSDFVIGFGIGLAALCLVANGDVQRRLLPYLYTGPNQRRELRLRLRVGLAVGLVIMLLGAAIGDTNWFSLWGFLGNAAGLLFFRQVERRLLSQLE